MNTLVFILDISAILIALSIHESAHAFVAYQLGDPTAKHLGRLSLNPFRHLDLTGSLIVPLFLYLANGFIIGWGKPVPINPLNFKNPLKGSALVSLAGPLSNLLTALLIALPLKYLPHLFPASLLVVILTKFLDSLLTSSIVFSIFNLLPFPPLDGSKIIGLVIPRRWQMPYYSFLENGSFYFAAFILFDMMVVKNTLGISLLDLLLSVLAYFIKSAILLST